MSLLEAARRVVLLASVAVAPVACTLFIDTTGFVSEAAEDAASPPDASVADAAATDATDASSDPCEGDPVFCETFDAPDPLGRYVIDTDPSTSVGLDDSVSVSPPRSAKFVVSPDGNQSADSSLKTTTTASVGDFSFDADVLIEKSEPVVSAGTQLLALSDDQTTDLVLGPTGDVDADGDPAKVKSLVTGRWIHMRIEVRLTKAPGTVTFVFDGAAEPSIAVSSSWHPGPLTMRFGLSETFAPMVGWLVRWDNIVVRKLD